MVTEALTEAYIDCLMPDCGFMAETSLFRDPSLLLRDVRTTELCRRKNFQRHSPFFYIQSDFVNTVKERHLQLSGAHLSNSSSVIFITFVLYEGEYTYLPFILIENSMSWIPFSGAS